MSAGSPSEAPPRLALHVVLRVVLSYAAFATVWIVLSDALLAWLDLPPLDSQRAGTLKGLLFVAVSSLLLFWLLWRWFGGDVTPLPEIGAGKTAPLHQRRTFFASVALFSLIFLILGSSGMLREEQRHRDSASEQLQAVARLKLAQLEGWLDERRRDAEVVRTSQLFQEELGIWRARRDPALGARLLARLESFASALGYQSVALCDGQGEILLQAGPMPHPTSAPLRQAVRAAIASGKPSMTELYRMEEPAPAHIHFDFAAPIQPGAASSSAAHAEAPRRAGRAARQTVSAQASKPAADAAAVLRIDVAATLFDMLQHWPVPSQTAEVMLIRKVGDEVLYLNTLRHRSESALVLTEPLARQEALAARVLATDYRPGEVVEAIDYRGARVLGLGLPVPGVEWHLVAKIDHDEVFSQARIGVLWIALASLMTWLVAVAFAGLALQRRELHHAQRQSEAQAEKLRALQLLEAFAQSSNDLIFAQDRAGRYTLFNPAAERATGKSAAEVLGRDETAVFPLELAQPLIADNRRVLQEGCLLTREEKLPMAEGEKTYLTTKGPLRDAEGQIIGMFGICHDITARAASEAALRQSHAELERFNRAMIGRELDMIALKRRINALSIELGRAPPFDLSRIDAAQAGQEGQGP